MELSYSEELRYNRQIILKQVDFEGQEKLKNSHMLIVGLGGLGCAVAQTLCVAGVGKLTLLDFDRVSLSNLQRQILHNDARLEQLKVDSAQTALQHLNPYVQVNTLNQPLATFDLPSLLPQFDVVLDCTDNVEARNLLDVACQKLKIPLVSGAAIRFEGQVSVFTYADHTPTYRQLSQLLGNTPLSCVEAGVIAPIVGIVGNIQALEAIKVCLKIGQSLVGRLLFIDGLTMEIRQMQF